MSVQIIIVAFCLFIAIAFMARKVYRTVRRKATCDCGCSDCSESTQGSCCSAKQNKGLNELKPLKKQN